MARITVTTANICGNPMRPKWAVRKRMRRALAQSGAVFGQEIARSNRWRRGNYNRAWRAVAAVFGKVTLGGRREVPISVPKGWEILAHRVIAVHGGKARVSPARYITVVRCRVSGFVVSFVNCHPVSKPRPGVPYSRWRMNRWDAYHARLRRVVAKELEHADAVVAGGDMNKHRASIPTIHPEQRVLISAGLDHLWGIPAPGIQVAVTHRRRIGRTLLMDHPILSATFVITRT